MKKHKYHINCSISSSLIALVFLLGILLLGRHYLAQRAATLAQSAQCNTELQNRLKTDNSFQDIKVYRAIFSSKYNDCVVANYYPWPADSQAGEDTEWLEIDSISIKGKTYWSETYPRILQDSELAKIFNEQLAKFN